MYIIQRRLKHWSRRLGSEKGFSLVETLVAICLSGIITGGFLGGLSTTFMAGRMSQEKVAVESLAKSQMEYIKIQDYVPMADYDPGDPDNRYNLIVIPSDLVGEGYSIEINTPETVVSPGTGEDFELQKITVVVKFDGEQVLAMSNYKTGRTT